MSICAIEFAGCLDLHSQNELELKQRLKQTKFQASQLSVIFSSYLHLDDSQSDREMLISLSDDTDYTDPRRQYSVTELYSFQMNHSTKYTDFGE